MNIYNNFLISKFGNKQVIVNIHININIRRYGTNRSILKRDERAFHKSLNFCEKVSLVSL